MSMDEEQTLTPADVRELIKKDIRDNFATQKAYSEALGIQPSFLSEVLRGIRFPNTELLDRLQLDKVKVVFFTRRSPTPAGDAREGEG